MQDNKNFEIIVKTISKILGISTEKVNIDSKATDYKNWDSINQVNIILELEKNFNKKVPTSKISKLNNVKNILKFF
tara:strand:- start:419 stop:646 length:228 start_codon:yes stop_codon:yes gene_type:complete